MQVAVCSPFQVLPWTSLHESSLPARFEFSRFIQTYLESPEKSSNILSMKADLFELYSVDGAVSGKYDAAETLEMAPAAPTAKVLEMTLKAAVNF